jgi:hypothetical protein
VWLFFSHVNDANGLNEEQYLVTQLDQVGRRLDVERRRGASVYLYDLSPSAAANVAKP